LAVAIASKIHKFASVNSVVDEEGDNIWVHL